MNLTSRLSISLIIKFIGYSFHYLVLIVITKVAGMELFGLYSILLSIFSTFFAICNLGFPQIFIRESPKLDIHQKKLLLRKRITQTKFFAIFLIPFIILLCFITLNIDWVSAAVAGACLLIFSGFRIKFMYLRTQTLRHFSEAPETLIKPLTLAALLLSFRPTSLEGVLLCYLFSLIATQLSIEFLIKHGDGRNHSTNIYNKNKEIRPKLNKKIWLYSILTNFRDFFELYIISVTASLTVVGQYKIALIFLVALTSVYNALNLINSSKYAELISRGDSEQINKKVITEFKRGTRAYIFITSLFLISSVLIPSLFEYIRENIGLSTIIMLLTMPVIQLMFGPTAQLLLHNKDDLYLILILSFRISIFATCIVVISVVGNVSLELCIGTYMLSELFVQCINCWRLSRKMNYNPPITYIV